MPAKKTAPKPSRGKKTVSRPPARKAAVRKPTERVKVVSHARAKTAPTPVRKTAAPAPPTHDSSSEAPHPMRTAAETKAPVAHDEPLKPTPTHPATPPPRAHAATPALESDDADAAEPGSLLAGPRNVQPYIAKRGEQYMSKEQTEHFRQILLSWKRDLMEEVDRTVTHMKDEAANFPDPNDRATQEEEFSLELRTRDRERKLIRKIDEAIKRIEDGTYGYCLETGEEIGIKRLEARPVATLSIEAQERRERRERQYGDRDDRYR